MVKVPTYDKNISRNTYYLDHFYCSIGSETFIELQKIATNLQGVIYKEANIFDQDIIGLYFQTQNGQFFEFLKNDTAKFCSIVLSSFDDLDSTLEYTRSSYFENYYWELGKPEYLNNDPNKKWFTPIWMKKKNENIQENISKRPNYTNWIINHHNMRYSGIRNKFDYVNEANYRKSIDDKNIESRSKAPIFEQITEIQYVFDKDTDLELIREQIYWSTKEVKLKNGSLFFSLSNPNGEDIRFVFRKSDTIQNYIEKVQFKIVEGLQVNRSMDLSPLSVTITDDIFEIEFN